MAKRGYLVSDEILKNPDEKQRKILWIVLLLNIAIAAGFFVAGAIGNSTALFANGLDNTSDSIVYAISLFALGRSGTSKRAAANVSGVLLLIFAGGIIVDAFGRLYSGYEP